MATGLNIKRSSRIFHIANECYIIYLGVKTDEDRPFLRVGNMEKIDDKILDVISNTVIAARFTGNPLYELNLDKTREINYIGDTAVINRMKTFLNSFELPSDGAVDYHNVKDREQRDIIYFYNNGNIKLNYKEEPIFDLYRRSEADQHFVRQCDEIKKSFSRNPLRYTKHDFRGSGILLSGDNLLVFSGSQFFSASLGSDYFSQLASAGIDPDHIDVHYSPINSGLENEDSSFALIELFKRSSDRNAPFTVLAKNPDYTRKIGALFPGAVIKSSGREWTQLFPGLKTRERGQGLEINGSGFPADISVGGKSPGSELMTLNQYSGILSVDTESGIKEIAVPDGVLCNLLKNPPPVEELVEIYISRMVPLIKGFSSDKEYKIALAMQKMLKMLASVVDGKSNSGLIMRSSVFNFSDMLKGIQLKSDSILTCYFENALNILELSLSRSEIDAKIVKNINSVKIDINGILNKSDKADSLLPVACDIYTNEYPMLLYRSVKSTAKKADYLLAAQIARDISGEHDLSPQYYSDEKVRLIKLIDMLSSATDLEVDNLLEKEKPSEPYRERTAEVLDNRGNRSDSIPVDQEKTGQSRKGFISKRHGERRRRLPLWLLLLLIPLVLAFLWGGYKGVNYLIKGDGGAVLASGDGSSSDGTGTAAGGTQAGGTEAGGTQAGGTESDGTEADGTEADGTEADGTEADGTEADGTEADGTEAGGTEAGGTEAGGTEAGGTEADGTEADGTEADGTEADGTDADGSAIGAETDSKKNESELKLKDSASETDNREGGPESIVIETEDRPTSTEEVKAYLSVGDFHISEVDIHLVSNRIAVDNNYRDLDYEVYDGADPNWIYPGNRIVLPDGKIHNVVKGDTIWYLAARYIRTSLERDIPLFEENRKEAENGSPKAISALKEIADGSPCSDFREKIHEVLNN